MSGSLIVSAVGKSYRNWGGELRRIGSWFGVPLRPRAEQWVLKNVSFTVSPGEAVGVIGQNGAGKSTLLKLITGITRPTSGSVQMSGRVSAILELGMGFNPELTGRQNASHAAGLMGYARDEIEQVMPDLESFAEIGDYFDQPMRTYSSGMQMRVAFSVATAFRPDLLIVDEALSVGDAYFQHKSFARIREFQKEGTTLLIVSHDRSAIQGLCQRALLLERGLLIKDGDPEEVMDFYNALIAENENASIRMDNSEGKAQTQSGSGEVEIVRVELLNAAGKPVEYVDVGEDVTVAVELKVKSAVPKLILGYMIRDRLGQSVYGTNTWQTQQQLENIGAGSRLVYEIAFTMNLGRGSYSIAVAAVGAESHLVSNYHWWDRACLFTVTNLGKNPFEGVCWMPPKIEIKEQA
ncbi:MAG: ABC transporter ATP-binding protein [Gammaproteobacteria bacterium]|nr:ABC transporter ATP-binding protein [Gammaproteobacteria bacterium]